jgi:hypothetical protein
MHVKHRLSVGVVLGALVLVGVAAGAKEPQFRDSVNVREDRRLAR